MSSRTDTAGHTGRAFIYQVMDHWREGKVKAPALAGGRIEPLTCGSAVEHPNHQTTTSLKITVFKDIKN